MTREEVLQYLFVRTKGMSKIVPPYQRTNLDLCHVDLQLKPFILSNHGILQVQINEVCIVFIDLKKTYDKVPREVHWWAMTQKDILKKYINILQDIYQEVKANVRTCKRGHKGFFQEQLAFIKVGLSPFLFTAVLDEITQSIQEDVSITCCLPMTLFWQMKLGRSNKLCQKDGGKCQSHEVSN